MKSTIQHIMRKTASIGLLLMACTGASAQTGDEQSMQLDIYGELKLFLRDANKISAFPETKEGKVDMTTLQYGIIPGKRNFESETKPIPAAKINVDDKLGKLYRGYLRGGMGLYSTPLAEVYYMDGRSKKGSFGVHGKHVSTAGSMAFADSIPDSFSHNAIDLWGKVFLKKSSLDIATVYNREVYHYYGFSPDSFPLTSLKGLRNRFNTFGLNTSWKTFERDSSKINLRADVGYRYFGDAFKGNENNVDFRLNGRKFEKTELYILDFGVNYNKFAFTDLDTAAGTDKDNALIHFSPRASTRYMDFQFEAGMGIWIDSRGNQPFHFYPIAEGSYRLFQDMFIPYAGITGSMKLNTYQSIIQQNPFVLTDVELRNTSEKLRSYLGVRGSLTSAVSFNLNASYTDFEDYLLFINDTVHSSANQFRALYEDLSVTDLSAEVSYLGLEKLKFHLKGSYYLYDLANEKEPWHLPTYRVNLSSTYNMKDKFLFNLDLYLLSSRTALSDGFVAGSTEVLPGRFNSMLKGFADVNLGVEYRYTKRLSGFVKFNNVMASRYAMWNNYNLQRFNAMLGASFAF